MVGGNTILHTSDGGEHWIVQKENSPVCLYSACFVDSLNGCVVGDYGHILKTTDGGNNWQLVQSGRTIWLSSVCFCNRNVGYVAGVLYEDLSTKGILLNTRDGGIQWTEETVSTPLYTSCFGRGKCGWVAGADGSIYKYLETPD